MSHEKFFGIVILLSACFLGVFLIFQYQGNMSVQTVEAQAGSGSISGWAWGGDSIGWTSMSNETAGGGDDYNVVINPATQLLNGYAWNEFIGGINFAPVGPYPGLPNTPAKIDLITGELSGWIRACSVFATNCSGALRPNSERGGWEGWIKLRGVATNGSPYGVKVNFLTKELEGWAWGGGSEDSDGNKAVVGWISFNCKDRLQCGTSDYKITIPNFPPSATPIGYTAGDYCNPATALNGIYAWTFTDPDTADQQASYLVEVATDAGFSNVVRTKSANQVVANGAQGTASLDTPLPSYNTTFYWRVKVWDSIGSSSVFATGPSFATPVHAYPAPNFTYSPSSPTKDEIIQICSTNNATCTADVAKCYDNSNNEISCSGKTFNWTFEEYNAATGLWQAAVVIYANGTSNSSENPDVKFSTVGQKRAILRITDNIGSCSKTKSFRVIPLPKWKEITP